MNAYSVIADVKSIAVSGIAYIVLTKHAAHALTFARSRWRCKEPKPKGFEVFNFSQETLRTLTHWTKIVFATLAKIRLTIHCIWANVANIITGSNVLCHKFSDQKSS